MFDATLAPRIVANIAPKIGALDLTVLRGGMPLADDVGTVVALSRTNFVYRDSGSLSTDQLGRLDHVRELMAGVGQDIRNGTYSEGRAHASFMQALASLNELSPSVP